MEMLRAIQKGYKVYKKYEGNTISKFLWFFVLIKTF